MKLVINGVTTHVQPPSATGQSLDWLLQNQGFVPPYVVAVNQGFVAKNLYTQCFLKEGDTIEVVHAITGG